ncbi:hypothetical protein DZF79_02885 [Vibrio parahaemolyticus]|nr:hypothetical protein [Vibrio parahaemolyticus]
MQQQGWQQLNLPKAHVPKPKVQLRSIAKNYLTPTPPVPLGKNMEMKLATKRLLTELLITGLAEPVKH